ncbi:MAG TPA: flagellar basal body L-ring protein FlgH [Steroidobacteraceae bacterium]|jgi:flagellar L-ring protein precursor FlgH|nr:flagellar basal body L-ring protein FlgH [Steroidobacteraceae bacterium]
MRTAHVLLALAALCGASACQTTRPPKSDDGMAWAQEQPPPPSNGAIYQAGREVVLAENPIAHHVGDIVTIVLNEATTAQKNATTTTSKANTIAMPGTQLLGKNISWLNNNVGNSSKFDGEGASAQSDSLTGYLTATVLKVLPNGNLFIAGEKQIGLNQGKEYIRVTGVIRPIDLASDDSIPSFRVASAKITYNGKGAINDANAQSWLSRFFNSPWVPF